VQPPVLPIVLPPPLYSELERQAEAQERDPVQQARWIIRQALEAPQALARRARPTEPAGASPALRSTNGGSVPPLDRGVPVQSNSPALIQPGCSSGQ
jgi:hypothetical protein